MNRWAWVAFVLVAGCTRTSYQTGHTWGIEVPQEVNALLTDAKLAAGFYSTPETFTLISGKRVTAEIHALLDAYKGAKHISFKDFPESKSFAEHDLDRLALYEDRDLVRLLADGALQFTDDTGQKGNGREHGEHDQRQQDGERERPRARRRADRAHDPDRRRRWRCHHHPAHAEQAIVVLVHSARQ